ncbi:hypothetical protein [Stratiformator vulcanicus]|uniref:Outer membrane protein beta-barrel domain-containing protein n=1 Tax=Stratiformator vulcanicus TaxID=2527980 RepID=A0A517QVS2_9PLAN|nr:hypothetical protein [Stratiformator vulcanicus]QDT35667.1 hypothetical protein Pan189_00200 [Stratiformator vulcanicus]
MMRHCVVIACALLLAAPTVRGDDRVELRTPYEVFEIEYPAHTRSSAGEACDFAGVVCSFPETDGTNLLASPPAVADASWVDETEPIVIRGQSIAPVGLVGIAGDLIQLVGGSTIGAATGTVNGVAGTSLSTLRSIMGSKGRLRFDYLYDDDINRYGGHLLTQTGNGVGFDAEGHYWDRHDNANDDFWTGDLNLILSLSSNPRMIFRSGAGMAFIHVDDTDFGYNITHGVDVYLLGPFLFNAEIDWGEISGEGLLHYRVAFGAQFVGLEWFAGYDSYKLGSLRIDGLLAGASIWY